MTAIFRVEFFTADEDSHPTLMTREEAIAWLRSSGLTEVADASGVTRIEDLDDERLGRAIVSGTTAWIDESGSKWVRFLEKGLVEGGIAAVRADSVKYVRVTVEMEADQDDVEQAGHEDDDDSDEPAGIRVELPPPPNGWMN